MVPEVWNTVLPAVRWMWSKRITLSPVTSRWAMSKAWVLREDKYTLLTQDRLLTVWAHREDSAITNADMLSVPAAVDTQVVEAAMQVAEVTAVAAEGTKK
jgi:hypothetical protein